MEAVGSNHVNGADENNTFAKYTPSGTIQLDVTNDELQGRIKPGMEFYVDFSEVDKPAEEV